MQIVLLKKDNWLPSKPWVLRVVVPAELSKSGKQGSWHFGSFPTKKQAIESVSGYEFDAKIIDTRNAADVEEIEALGFSLANA
tara:strand:+ start:926 stop:1174 length:249 start_codon:yes stop_codon:yes gene_type:complete